MNTAASGCIYPDACTPGGGTARIIRSSFNALVPLVAGTRVPSLLSKICSLRGIRNRMFRRRRRLRSDGSSMAARLLLTTSGCPGKERPFGRTAVPEEK